MRGFKWRGGDIGDKAPDDEHTTQLYDRFSHLRKKIIYQKIVMGTCLTLLGLCAYLVIFPIFPNPPTMLAVMASVPLAYQAYNFRKTLRYQKELINFIENDLSRYDDEGRYT